MDCGEVKEYVKTAPEYKNIWDNPNILISLGGSYAYGTNTKNSDIDVRGIMFEPIESLLGLSNFEQKEIHNSETGVDTVIYGFRKMIKLLLGNNPNCIEIISPQERNIVYISDIGKELIEHRHDFLSKKAAFTFGAYAKAQLGRIENAMARDRYDQAMMEKHMLNSIEGMIHSMNDRYQELPEGGLTIEIVDSKKPELEKEIVVNCNLYQYPLRDFKGIWSDMQNVVKDYGKLNYRNQKKDDNHMNKHAMHLVRLLLMGIDLLKKEEIITYRENDLDLLMSIRNGEWMGEDGKFLPKFYKLVEDLSSDFDKAISETKLPEKPNFKQIEKFVIRVNKKYLGDTKCY